MKNKYLWVGVIVSAVLVLDQVTKYLVMRFIRPYGFITVIPGFIELTHLRNPGAAFGIFSRTQGTGRIVFFIMVTLIALGVIALLIRKAQERLLLVAFSLIAGGAVGNLVDRIRFGEVVDFINVYIWSKVAFLNPWPTFNIADSAISVGVGLLVLDMFLKKPEGSEKSV